MWNFIKYCFRCFLMSISAAFGNNPKGLTIKSTIVGIVTMFVLLGLGLLLLYLVRKMIKNIK